MRIKLDDPKMVGQSEYRAIYDLLVDAEVVSPEGIVTDRRHALVMLSELDGWVCHLRKLLKGDPPGEKDAHS